MELKRRHVIAMLAGGAIASPLVASAQPRRIPTVGALVIGNTDYTQFWNEFRLGLKELGYEEGRNVRFDLRSAQGDARRLGALAAELVALNVDVIVTWFTPTAVAAKNATKEIPIVMADAGDPVGTGLVASLPRPGGNVTGIAGITAELAGKSVELIRDMLPGTRSVAALVNVADPFSKPFLEQILAGGEKAGVGIVPVRINGAPEFEAAFAAVAKDRPDALIVQPSLPSRRAAELAIMHRLPAVSVPRWFAEEGGLMSYSAKYDALYRKAAVYVDRILKGTPPADLPVEQPVIFELVVNLKTARAIGVTIQPDFLVLANVILE
jgi:putative ABC transport system substrate-binding protein